MQVPFFVQFCKTKNIIHYNIFFDGQDNNKKSKWRSIN